MKDDLENGFVDDDYSYSTLKVMKSTRDVNSNGVHYETSPDQK